jgi:hypothetical protein
MMTSSFLHKRAGSTLKTAPYQDKLVISFSCSKALTKNDYKELVSIVGAQKGTDSLFVHEPIPKEPIKKQIVATKQEVNKIESVVKHLTVGLERPVSMLSPERIG